MLAEENWSLRRKGQQSGLSAGEHGVDTDHSHGTHVRLQAVVIILLPHLPENEAEDEVEENAQTESSSQRCFISERVSDLAACERLELDGEAFAWHFWWQFHAFSNDLAGRLWRPVGQLGKLLLIRSLNQEHDKVGWVVVSREGKGQRVEVGSDAGGRALVDNLALGKEDRRVEELKNLGAGLVDGAHHGLVGLGQLLQHATHVVGSRRVQTTCWLIQKGDRWVGDQLGANGGALLLAAGQALDHVVACKSVRALRQTQGLDHVVDQALHLLVVHPTQTKLSGEGQDLLRSLGRIQRVVLHHVAEDVLVLRGLDGDRVQGDLPIYCCREAPARTHPAGEEIQERRLPRARRAQDAGELSGLQATRDSFKDLLAPALRLHGVVHARPGQMRWIPVLVDVLEDCWLRCLLSHARVRLARVVLVVVVLVVLVKIDFCVGLHGPSLNARPLEGLAR
mmetsp:Transcript_27792/g.44568  ORF Transcript_27792/g.44568 Transcript_27792/m.44568 type:complete len:452 (-) Transcript_27792:54-1409(-)